ncbi:4'-phosphopantetheinyl transferase EntD [Rhizobium aquaticum]|uniref:Enterobactin synthase component D n=1 Tax=Rhizobium aquaticum TaxID=1549636 RepID=A0ABV2J293_9HYPH
MTGPNRRADRSAEERALDEVLAAILPPGIHADCRVIRDGDQALLLPDEAASITSKRNPMRDASGAARHVARGLLNQAGLAVAPLMKSPDGAPVWPLGVVGSMAHDDDFAVAAVASAASFSGLGIDVEPGEPLAEDVAAIVRMPGDVLDGVEERLASRLLFAAKEAVYKAVFPRDNVILDFEDVVIDFTRGEGRTRTGRNVKLVYILKPRIVVLAFEPV